MGTDRSGNQDRKKEKICIVDELGIDADEIYETLRIYYIYKATHNLKDTLNHLKKIMNMDDKVKDYFFIIGLIEFERRFYGKADYEYELEQ